jgi:hypothetical protein
MHMMAEISARQVLKVFSLKATGKTLSCSLYFSPTT